MNDTARGTTLWERSAFRHLRDGRPVAALLSWHLAHLAQIAREEFEETHQAAIALRHRMQANKEIKS